MDAAKGESLATMPAEVIACVCAHLGSETDDVLALTSTCSRTLLHCVRSRVFCARSQQATWVRRLLAVLWMAMASERDNRAAVHMVSLPYYVGDEKRCMGIHRGSCGPASSSSQWYVSYNAPMGQHLGDAIPVCALGTPGVKVKVSEADVFAAMIAAVGLAPHTTVIYGALVGAALGAHDIGAKWKESHFATYDEESVAMLPYCGRAAVVRLIDALAAIAPSAVQPIPKCALDVLDANRPVAAP